MITIKHKDYGNNIQNSVKFNHAYGMDVCKEVRFQHGRSIKELNKRIVKFYFQKINGEVREAWGTLASDKISAIAGTDNRKKNDSI